MNILTNSPIYFSAIIQGMVDSERGRHQVLIISESAHTQQLELTECHKSTYLVIMCNSTDIDYQVYALFLLIYNRSILIQYIGRNMKARDITIHLLQQSRPQKVCSTTLSTAQQRRAMKTY